MGRLRQQQDRPLVLLLLLAPLLLGHLLLPRRLRQQRAKQQGRLGAPSAG
jgi:hypothetical protein